MRDENDFGEFQLPKKSPRYELEPFDEDFYDEGEHRPRKKYLKVISVAVVFLVLASFAFFLGERFKSTGESGSKGGGISNPSVNSAGVLTEIQLRDLVLSSHLTVYWTGPITGYKYSIYAPKSGVVVIKYLPEGNGINDTAPNYRVIGTYLQADATTAVQTAGKKEGSVGFVNVDGNAVFYVRTRPTNVYVAIKGKGVQVEIFDPIADQSLALALFKGSLQQIK